MATSSDFKGLWLRRLKSTPNKLDPKYHQKVKANNNMISVINAGKMDDAAQRATLEYNIAELTKRQRIEEANAVRAQLISFEEVIAQKEMSAAIQESNRLLEQALNQW